MTKYPCDADNPYRHLQSSDDYRLGDTPNQLNTKQANWVDVLVVDGLVYDKERIRELVAQIDLLSQTMIKLDDWISNLPIPTEGACTQLITIKQVLDATPQQCLRELEEQNANLVAERDALAARIQAAERVEKIFSETPELVFDDCLKLFADEIREIEAASAYSGYVAGWSFQQKPLEPAATQYADRIRRGGE